MSAISSSSDDPVIRILLMGRYGSGKSSSGNTILGERKFKVQKQKKKHESEVCDEVTQIGGKQVHLILSPDLLDPDLNKEKLEKMKEQLVSRCSAGLSAVLFTVPLEKPVQNEEEILDYIQCLFGPEVQKYTMVLFTSGDELEDLDQTILEYLQNVQDVQQLVTECGGKFHCFNNNKKVEGQVQELRQKIEGMMMKNGGKCIMEGKRRRHSMVSIVNFSGEFPAEDTDETGVIPESKDQVRLVLLGKTGSGKIATANTTVDRNLFSSSTSTISQTKQCQSETTVRFGKEISAIDMPGLYDNELSKEQVQNEIGKCITLSSPGPYVFIVIIKVVQITDEEINMVDQLREVLGEQIPKYTIETEGFVGVLIRLQKCLAT